MNLEPLLNIVIEYYVLLNTADSAVLDDDAAVNALEYMAYELRRLDPVLRARFLEHIAHRASLSQSEHERRCIETMATDLGITSTEEEP